jgi:uroporphyrinogen-III synthase
MSGRASLGGRCVLTLESRRSPELAFLVMNYGGTPIVAPAVREVPLESNDHVRSFADDVIRQRYDMVVLLTGVGVRLMMQVVDPAPGRDAFIAALRRTRLAARGPKPVAALRELGLTPWATAPSPNTWRELLAVLDSRAGEAPLGGARLAIQEYGSEQPDLVQALVQRGAEVTTVPIYRWAMPEDLAPVRRAVWSLVRNEIDIVVLTASIQLVHLLQVAEEMGLAPAVRRALGRTVIASIGPMTSEELQRHGLPIDFEPSHPKMGFLIKEVADQCEPLLQAKRCLESAT